MNRKLLVVALTIALAAAMIGGTTMAWFTDSASSEPAEFTAGTLLVEANTSMIYGVEYKEPENQKGTLYEIFVDKDNGSVTYAKLYDSNRTALNALAFDRKGKRLYYADGNGNLFFYDFATSTGDKSAGKLFAANTKIYNAAYGLEHYWFVKENTDDLYKVSFSSIGTINQVILHHENFTGDPNKQFGFGDISFEMRDGIIYGSTTGPGTSNKEFFSYNVNTGEYEQISSSANSLQLAFAADGNLYGTVTRDLDWYMVDTSTGVRTQFAECDKMFGDLASNHQNNWNPGDCDMARYYVQNMGTKKQYVRVTLSGQWNFEGSPGVISLSLCDGMEADWVMGTDNRVYYKHVLEPGEQALLCVKICLNGPATNDDYQGKTYTLNSFVEAIQTTHGAASQDGWAWSPGN